MHGRQEDAQSPTAEDVLFDEAEKLTDSMTEDELAPKSSDDTGASAAARDSGTWEEAVEAAEAEFGKPFDDAA